MGWGQSKSMDHISDLPDEIFARILNLVPIKQVIRCSVVSKRWDAACKYIIRTRQSLIIGRDSFSHQEEMRGWNWNREKPSQRLDRVFSANGSLPSAMMRTLSQMDLTRLCVITNVVCPAIICPFIRKFAKQLTMMEIGFSVSLIGADVFPHLTRLQCRRFDANSSAAFPKLAELLIYRRRTNEKLPNMRLPSLRKLLISSSYMIGDAELITGFIQANADNLTALKMIRIPLQLDHAVKFPNLMELNCQDVDVAVSCVFPALTHLTVHGIVRAKFLTSLTAGQILSLEVSDDYAGDNLVPAFSRMMSLKSLTFTYDGSKYPDGSLSSIFNNKVHLEKVHLHVCGDSSLNEDEAIATLVNQNPKLSHVYLERICVTDAALTSLAQLHHLTHVSVFRGKKMTSAGVLTLLRGASRKILRKITILRGNVDEREVSREISHMCEERGTTFDAPVTRYYLEYEIHA